MKVFDYVITGATVFFSALLVFSLALIGYAGALVVAEAKTHKACLEAGYPHHTVTWDLEGYCMDLEGAVTIGIEKL